MISDISVCLDQAKTGVKTREPLGPYGIILKNISGEFGELSSFMQSSVCKIFSPPAENEQTNFHEAIRKGVENLYSNTKGEAGNVCRMIILRISNSASIISCAEWTRWYLDHHVSTEIDFVLLYQQAVTVSSDFHLTTIIHHLTFVPGVNGHRCLQKADGTFQRLPDISFLVGKVSREQTRLALVTAEGQTVQNSYNGYAYQRGDIYKKIEAELDIKFELSNPAPGFMIHGVLERAGKMISAMSMTSSREKVLRLLP